MAKPAEGKTPLAVATSYRTIQNGFETFCITAAELIERLPDAGRKVQLEQTLSAFAVAIARS